jgi:uncharacterized membrane protein YkoI
LQDFKNDIIQQCINKDNEPKKTYADIGKSYGLDSESVRSIYRYWKRKNTKQVDIKINPEQHEISNKETIVINKDGSHTSDILLKMTKEQAKDTVFLLKAHGYKIEEWDLISARNNIWNIYSKQDGIQVLYSSKITVKPKKEYIWNEEDIKKLFNTIKTDFKNKININSLQYKNNGNILIVPIADLHYGLYSDEYSTGNNYNLKIAEELYYHTLNDIILRVKDKSFEKVLFILGNDFINMDNINGTTTKGTPQDNSGLYFEIINNAIQLAVNGIDLLTTIAPVDVLYVSANHDLHTMFGVMQTLKAWYKDNHNINIDDSPLPRKYYKYGKVLIGLSHNLKIKDALKIITSEAKDKWSDCNHMIWMLAHLHQQMNYEKQGYLEIMRLPTISGWSRWTNQMGYIQSEKKNKSFIINEELGITDEINTIII